MIPAVCRTMGVRVLAAAASVALVAGLWGCAADAGRVVLQISTLAPLSGPPGAPRLAVRLLRDARETEELRAREGWFREYLPDEALEPGVVRAVTQAILNRLRASGEFAEVIPLDWDEGDPEYFLPAGELVPADLILEADLLAFYVERSTVSHPFLSLITTPLTFPLAALSGVKLLPTPITPILPVTYRANLTIHGRLLDSRTGAVLWERTVEGMSELSETVAGELIIGKRSLMGKAASRVLRTGIEKFAQQLPPPGWFAARWLKRVSPGPVLPATAPR